MKKVAIASVFACAVLAAAALPAFANTDLIISEYVEGSSNNKAIELWNHSGGPIDMTAGAYKLRIYSNGSASVSSTITLTGTVANNATFVITHSSATAALLGLANQTSGSLNFNGNDAVELVKSAANTTVDVFGQIGVDPGAGGWTGGGLATTDRTLRRKAAVCDGDLVGSDAFDPSVQYDGFAVDTFGGIGQHSDNCGPVPATLSSWGTVKSLYR